MWVFFLISPPLLVSFTPEWQEKLQTKLPENYWKDMQKKIDDAYLAKECTPSKNQILRVYETLNPNDVRAVLLGQDPYPKK
jgi:uracil DNA glycosylase